VTQPEAEAQPRLVKVADRFVVQFDGVNDFLQKPGTGVECDEATVILVAAPLANPGAFRAFLATNREQQNDFTSGLTIDQSHASTQRFEVINPEGRGFQGARDLMSDAHDFGTWHTITVTAAVGEKGTTLHIDGGLNGTRERTASKISLDQLTVGARCHNFGAPAVVQGFLEGGIAEVLIYGRALDAAERERVESYLKQKHEPLWEAKLERAAFAAGGKRLVSVPCPPVQMFVPGFTVRELPLDLTNINNVKYRPDGKLVALAYDGNIWLLSDSDGDGLEDRAELFWDNQGRLRAPIGMDLTPPGYEHGDGAFVPSKGKCSLIVDTDGDDRADREIVIAEGWKEGFHGVDALGVAYDPSDGSVYFGLGTTNFASAYVIDDNGKANYRLDGEKGTIMRIAPDLKSREIVATGIRFPVGLDFNGHGDLFCTDQEGATWLPNGNPLDELLHIRKGRHYGFPPRHPRHLPDVIDEPSVFDYTPQHQSTCGLNFNEPVNGGPVFGPESWRGEALVTGYSRGKLYRTQLVRTERGYVAQNDLLAALNMLTADACVSPQGDLVVAVHSGGPDWGSGPSGKGKLYKIRYSDKESPQPLFAWAQGPHEVRIAFDRPLDLERLRGLASSASIEFGRYVAAGDRFEALRPGYQVVQDQMNTPRFDLPVHSVQVTGERRTLVLTTGRQEQAAGYAVTLPGFGRPEEPDGGALEQVAAVDLQYDLSGVQAEWTPGGSDAPAWSGWLPHLDSTVARPFTAGSAEHEQLWSAMERSGKLTLRTQLDLWQMLRPAVQPGAKIDYEWPREDVTLTISSPAAIEVHAPGAEATVQRDGGHTVQLTLMPESRKPLPLEIVAPTGAARFELAIHYHTNEDSRPRALPLRRFLLPWASLSTETAAPPARREIPELAGGSWERGREVFLGNDAGCSKCHTFYGRGGRIGPDLSNLPHRDFASVHRDVTEPSFAINPDYVTHTVVLKDGRVLSGVVRSEGERLQIGDEQGRETVVDRDEIELMRPSAVSTMPKDIVKTLGPERLRDLLTYLLTPPPQMPDYGPLTPPPPRSQSEVDAVLAGAGDLPEELPPLDIVLVAGDKDHGPGEHDYPAWQTAWKRLLSVAEGVKAETAHDWPSAEQLQSADVLVFYQRGTWTPERARDIDAFLARGGGLVYIHYAVDGGTDPAGFAERIGLAWRGGGSRFRHGPLELHFDRGSRHPIARNFDRVEFHDESYWRLVGDPKRINLLASGLEENEPQPLFWTVEPNGGRVFVSIPGHFSWTFDDPLFRIVLLRGIAWSGGQPVDRLNELATIGARIERE
jgi:putative heme-binding domain-containing protein